MYRKFDLFIYAVKVKKFDFNLYLQFLCGEEVTHQCVVRYNVGPWFDSCPGEGFKGFCFWLGVVAFSLFLSKTHYS